MSTSQSNSNRKNITNVEIPIETIIHNFKEFLMNKTTGVENDAQSNPELELRFGKELHHKNINKSHFDSVIQWLLSTGFQSENDSMYMLRVSPILNKKFVGMADMGAAADDNIRLEIEGFVPIQEYCNHEDLEYLTNKAFNRENGISVKTPTTYTTAKNESNTNVSMDYVSSFMRFIRKKRRFSLNEKSAMEAPTASKASSSSPDGITTQPSKLMPANIHSIKKFNCKLSFALENELDKDDTIQYDLLHEWQTYLKTYRYIHRMSYRKKGLPFRIDLSVVKQTGFQEKKYNMRDSGVFERPEIYEIEVEFDNVACVHLSVDEIKRAITQAIKIISSGIQSSPYPIPYTEQFSVMDQYMRFLFGSDSRYQLGHNVSTRLFIAPGMVSLQMENVVDNDDVKESNVSILSNYSVTDKVDGLHKMMLISHDCRIYMIDTNMQVQFTGLTTNNKRLARTLLDGEHVMYDKRNKYLNRFMVFDVYYINEIDVREFPLHGDTLIGNDFVKKITPTTGTKSEFAYLIEEKHYRSRIFYIQLIVGLLNADDLDSNGRVGMSIKFKNYEIATPQRTIFDCTKKVIDTIPLLDYNTDGVIYTPLLLGVGATHVNDKKKINRKTSWSHMFKWKPLQDLTNDFLVTIVKDRNGEDYVYTRIINDKNGIDRFQQYKTLELRVGYNPDRDGYINPYQMMIDDDIPDRSIKNSNQYDGPYPTNQPTNPKQKIQQNDNYQPAKFYPDNPYDPLAHKCNVLIQEDANGIQQIRSEDGELIEDNVIVECRYNSLNENEWKWEVLRVRHDKTAEYRAGEKQYGNSFQTANSNWRIIHQPITEKMITTGKDIPTQINDSDASIYYVNVQKETKTERLGHFHNRYVKNTLIQTVSKPGQILIDFSVGKGGDLYKWKKARLSFVLGLDVHKNGITHRMMGACKRYIDETSKIEQHFRDKTLQCLFIHADTSKSILDGKSTFDEQSEHIIECVFGKNNRELYQNMPDLGNGVAKQYGRLVNRADIGSMQFAIHYMFESKEKLTGFIKNASDCIRKDGFLIGTCFDGNVIFNMLKDKKIGESHTLQENEHKIWSVTREYDNDSFTPDDSCLGMAIDVFHDTIGQTIREYLVNFEYLHDIMALFGFTPLLQDDLEAMDLPDSNANFELLFEKMINETRRNPKLASNYGNAANMTQNERLISFSNRYFIFKKTKNYSSANVVVAPDSTKSLLLEDPPLTKAPTNEPQPRKATAKEKGKKPMYKIKKVNPTKE